MPSSVSFPPLNQFFTLGLPLIKLLKAFTVSALEFDCKVVLIFLPTGIILVRRLSLHPSANCPASSKAENVSSPDLFASTTYGLIASFGNIVCLSLTNTGICSVKSNWSNCVLAIPYSSSLFLKPLTFLSLLPKRYSL